MDNVFRMIITIMKAKCLDQNWNNIDLSLILLKKKLYSLRVVE